MDFILSNITPILILAAIGIIILILLQRKKDAAFREQAWQQSDSDAMTKGLQITSHARGRVTGGIVMGNTDYQGTTGGIEWTLRSTIEAGRRGAWMRKARWRTNAVTLPEGKFILVISTPADTKPGPIQRGGFMNDLINKAADVMLDFYIGGYFGNEYKSLVNIGEDGLKLEREVLKDFLILTNHEAVAQRYFDDTTCTTIANWKKNSQGFSREGKEDQFGLLFAPDGVILGCQANMNNAEEVKLFSDFGAVLVSKMKGAGSGNR